MIRPLLVVTLLAAVPAVASCAAPHVVLPPPPPQTASEELRAAYFEQNRAEPVDRGQLLPRARMFQSRPTFLQRNVALKSGAVVHHVEDLRPLVADGSEAARAIDAALEKSGEARSVNIAAGVTSGVGTALGVGALVAGITGIDTSFLPGIQIGEPDDDGTPDDIFVIPGYIVWGDTAALVALATGTGLAVWGTSIDDDAASLRHEAFSAFDDGLRAKLGLPAKHSSTSAPAGSPGAPTAVPAPEGAPTQPLAPLEVPPSDEPFATPTSEELDVTP